MKYHHLGIPTINKRKDALFSAFNRIAKISGAGVMQFSR